jgi:hypothetical protein
MLAPSPSSGQPLPSSVFKQLAPPPAIVPRLPRLPHQSSPSRAYKARPSSPSSIPYHFSSIKTSPLECFEDWRPHGIDGQSFPANAPLPPSSPYKSTPEALSCPLRSLSRSHTLLPPPCTAVRESRRASLLAMEASRRR